MKYLPFTLLALLTSACSKYRDPNQFAQTYSHALCDYLFNCTDYNGTDVETCESSTAGQAERNYAGCPLTASEQYECLHVIDVLGHDCPDDISHGSEIILRACTAASCGDTGY